MDTDMNADFKHLTLDFENEVAIITISRPKAMNALNNELLQELALALEMSLEPPEVQALIITGEGDRSFVAGADIAEFNNITSAFEGREVALNGQDIMSSVSAMPVDRKSTRLNSSHSTLSRMPSSA